jgi:sulfur-oxidizing protein SoxX
MKFINIKKLLAIGATILLAGALNSHALAQQKNDPKYNKMMQDSLELKA